MEKNRRFVYPGNQGDLIDSATSMATSASDSISKEVFECQEAVKKTILDYRAAESDEFSRLAPMSALLAYLSYPQRLRSLCADLARTRRFQNYAYLHNNGFFVLYLLDPETGIQVRLHVWSPDHPPRHEQPHRHRMGFVSRVLAGVMRSTLFERVMPPVESAEGTRLFRELRIDAPAHSNFDVQQTVLVPGTVVSLRPLQQLVHRAGKSYRFAASGIHRVDSPANLTAPVITLTIWEPACQPSIAYEPVQPTTETETLAVNRLSAKVYDEVLGIVLDTVGQPA